jgi:hypothetical protein
MTPLTDEQRQALDSGSGHPVPVEDTATKKIYYLVDEEAYLHLKGLQAEHEEHCQNQLRELIEQGIRSPEVPAGEAFARLRALAQELAQTGS